MKTNNFFKQLTVLYVEDDETTKLEHINTLELIFTKVILAKDGEEALNLYKNSIKNNESIHLIISNVNLPKLNGLDFLEEVRKFDAELPFIVTTAKSETENLLKAIELNVNYYLIKPVSDQDLVSKIEHTFEKAYYTKVLNQKQSQIDSYTKAIDNIALVFKMKEDGTITFSNKCFQKLTKYTEHEMLSLNFEELIHPDIDRKYIQKAWKDVKSGNIWKGNTKFIDKNKEVFYLNNSTFKIEDDFSDEYITIGFLTTKENLEKREFQKKVIKNVQEFNKKEHSYKKIIEELQNKINHYDVLLPSVEKEKFKIKEKEEQIKFFEEQIKDMEENYSSILKKKKSTELNHQGILKKSTEENRKLKDEKIKQEEEIDALRDELQCTQEQNQRNLKRINNFESIIEDLEDKLKEKKKKAKNKFF
jgi:PAS domain S-box-containing protein